MITEQHETKYEHVLRVAREKKEKQELNYHLEKKNREALLQESCMDIDDKRKKTS